MDFLSVRDRRSFDFVSSIDLPYTPVNAFDLAALLPEVYANVTTDRIETTDDQKIIGISVCNYEQYIGGDLSKEQQRLTYIKNLLNQLPKDDKLLFRFFVINGNSRFGDYKITQEISEKLQGRRIEIIQYQNKVHDVWQAIQSCDLIISTRLHASIFACYSGVPFFLIEYHQKCSDFLLDVGQDESYRIYDGDADIDSVVSEISKILYDGIYIKPLYLRETIEKSRLNFKEISI
jgi:polysaccharide pyruvyl transferase WcaK-like protein